MVLTSRNFETPFIKAIRKDKSLPIADIAQELWIKDLKSPLRWSLMPLLRFLLSGVLIIVWFFKRLIPFQFSSHENLQKLICWFCNNFVTPEANYLILRHFWAESNLLNFLIENSNEKQDIDFLDLYPADVDEMLKATFVDHDQELFRYFGESQESPVTKPVKKSELKWDHWREIELDESILKRKSTQLIDFETAHVLFMCIFCLFLTADEYRGAINGFNLDQSIAIRAGAIIGDNSLVEYAYNKHPLYLVGPMDLTRRFILHGFFVEYLHERLLKEK
ncbi:MAG: hypothetical protein U0R17_02285 [Acidimicrobiia bacterium]